MEFNSGFKGLIMYCQLFHAKHITTDKKKIQHQIYSAYLNTTAQFYFMFCWLCIPV